MTYSNVNASQTDEELIIPSLKSFRTMNGINPSDFDLFWEKWPLVTTRYRADNGELRYVYANEIAYSAMKEGVLEFPDGSVFGKVAFAAEEDPQFPNSFEANNFTRLQLMVKDSKKFKDMNGWSYWLYVDGATSNPANDKTNAAACHACHTLVKDRDYIFAGPTFLGEMASWYGKIGTKFEHRFRTRSTKDLTPIESRILAMLPHKPQKVQSLRMRLFSGSQHESIGPLASFSSNKSTYLLVDPIQKRFLVAVPLKPTENCKDRALVLMDRRKSKTQNGKKIRVKYVSQGLVCNGKNKWVRSFDMPKELL